ncbi:MAG: lipopolysaccharide biosynthesis protein, partial [Candidatus Eisenbacteria bacterium]|nr:lipopolysaccharide biosynthesis protein [Candidatus Eisenbacteria bacterium]
MTDQPTPHPANTSAPGHKSPVAAASQSPPEPRERIGELVRQSGVYGLGALATQLAGFFLLPILARVLTPAQYGIVFLAEMLGLLLFVFSELGLTSAFFKFYADEREEERRWLLVCTVFNLLVVVSACVTLACAVFSGPLSSLVFGAATWRYAFVVVCLTNFLTVASRMPLDLLRIDRRAGAFVLISVTRLVGTFVVSLYLVVHAGRGAVGVLEGALVGTALGLALLLPVVLRTWRPRIDRGLAVRALKFAVLLVPGGLAAWALNQSDRYLLRAFGDIGMVATYGVGFKFASVLNVFLVTPFLTAWTPFMFRVSGQDDARRLYARVLTYFVLVGTWALVALSATIVDITRIVAGEAYADAGLLVPFVGLGFALYGVASIVVVGVYLRERTFHVSVAMTLGALVKIGLSIPAIPWMGAMGVALSTAVAFAAVVAYLVLVLRRLFPLPYELVRMFKVLVAGLVSLGLLAAVPLHGAGGVAAKAACSLGFFGLV